MRVPARLAQDPVLPLRDAERVALRARCARVRREHERTAPHVAAVVVEYEFLPERSIERQVEVVRGHERAPEVEMEHVVPADMLRHEAGVAEVARQRRQGIEGRMFIGVVLRERRIRGERPRVDPEVAQRARENARLSCDLGGGMQDAHR